MRYAKHGSRIFALCLIAALGLMAFGAVGAQAETGSSWMIAGTNVSTGTVKGKVDGTKFPILLSTLPGKQSVAIECTAFQVNNASLEANGGGKAELVFSTCNVKINNFPEPNCQVIEPVVAKVKALIVLRTGSGTEGFALLSPQGTNFTEISFKKGTSCIISPTVPVTGTAVVKDCNNEFKVEKKEHLIEEIQTTGDGLFFGKNVAALDGSVILEEINGQAWSGLVA